MVRKALRIAGEARVAAAKVIRQTWGSKDNLGQDNAQLRPDTHLPSNCNKWLWHIKRWEDRNKGMG